MRNSQKTLTFVRGLPGSGKSTLAKTLGGEVYTTDDYFMVDGEYRFDPKKLGEAHAWNTMLAKAAIESGVDRVIVANTSTQEWEMREYVKSAVQHGYNVEFVEPETEWAWDCEECARRNSHGVPLHAIEAMKDRFDYDPSVEGCLAAKAPWE